MWRVWQRIRSAQEIADNRFKRCTGREDDLLAYWPLVERADLEVPNLAVAEPTLHGRLGGDSPYTAPGWVQSDLPLDPLPMPNFSLCLPVRWSRAVCGGPKPTRW